MSAIPASQIVKVTPSVIAAGGNALDLVGLILTTNSLMPTDLVVSFTSPQAVAAYFGSVSAEAAYAAVYFAGYDGSTTTPGALRFYRYNLAAVTSQLFGGPLALTLAQVQALGTGSLNVTVNGLTFNAPAVNLSAVSSFSNAAATITTALAAYAGTVTASIAAAVMTVTAVTQGALQPGQVISGAGVTPGTTIVNQLTGTTGSTGTYTVSVSQTVASTTIKSGPIVVTYDSTRGGFVLTGGSTGSTATVAFATGTLAASLKLTAATGAVLSQGANVSTPAGAMDRVVLQNTNWATFTYLFEPVTADKVLFAAWNSAQNKRFAFAMWDTDIAPTQPNDTTSAGAQIRAANYGGTILIYQPTDGYVGAFLAGAIGSIDFTQTEGRATMAFRRGSGVTVGVSDATTAATLEANGYNYYGAWTLANNDFRFFYPGTITGDFKFIDSYVNQIQLNGAIQLAEMLLLINSPSIPYNRTGYGMIAAAAQGPILGAVDFGSIRKGITLSAAQQQAVNAGAGENIVPTLQQRGWYFQVKDAPPEVRAVRGTPPCTLWYVDGQSVQKIDIASIQVQ